MHANSPSNDNEAVESVPGVGQVRLLAYDAHGDHLDDHFQGEEGEDEVVEAFEDLAARRRAYGVVARLVHAQGDAVQQDHQHAQPLKPRATR